MVFDIILKSSFGFFKDVFGLINFFDIFDFLWTFIFIFETF